LLRSLPAVSGPVKGSGLWPPVSVPRRWLGGQWRTREWTGVLANLWFPSLMPGMAGYAEPQVSGRVCVPDGAGVAHWCRAGDHRVMVSIAMPGTQHRDVSPV